MREGGGEEEVTNILSEQDLEAASQQRSSFLHTDNKIELDSEVLQWVFSFEIISGVENPMRDEEQHKQEGNTRAGLSPTYDIFDFVA